MESYWEIAAACRVLRKDEPGYPEQLLRLHPEDRPDALYIAGEIPPLPAVAIVGTRSPDGHGIIVAKRLAKECAMRNITVVSGGAEGIDEAAHKGCIESGGRTIVVLAGGFERPYPSGCVDLFVRAVRSGGCLLSEHPPEVPPRRFSFLRRNRIIAAIAGRVIIVQARYRSGAISTASWANICSTDLFAAAGSPLNPLHQGTNRLIAEGKAKIIVTVESFFEELYAAACKTEKPANLPDMDEKELKILRLVGSEPMSIDGIAANCDMDVREVCNTIFNLEMKTMILASSPGMYIAAPHVLGVKNDINSTHSNNGT